MKNQKTVSERIMERDELIHRWMTAREMSEKLDIRETTVSRTFRDLYNRGELEREYHWRGPLGQFRRKLAFYRKKEQPKQSIFNFFKSK